MLLLVEPWNLNVNESVLEEKKTVEEVTVKGLKFDITKNANSKFFSF